VSEKLTVTVCDPELGAAVLYICPHADPLLARAPAEVHVPPAPVTELIVIPVCTQLTIATAARLEPLPTVKLGVVNEPTAFPFTVA
jgi:hypothetical protein